MLVFKAKYPAYSKKQHKRRKRSQSVKLSKSRGRLNLITATSYKVFFKRNTVLPKNYIVYMRRKNKIFFKKKKVKVFLRLSVNYVISSKNKNSRMGKGVGTLNRFAFFKRSSSVFLEFKNINYQRLKLILTDLRKRNNVGYLILL